MWLAINWNIVFVAVNLYHIAVIIYEKRPIKMAPKDKELYETLFKDLSPVEYLKVTKIADWKTVKKPFVSKAGLGLGLTIVESMVGRMGGKMTLIGPPTTFKLEIPCETDTASR